MLCFSLNKERANKTHTFISITTISSEQILISEYLLKTLFKPLTKETLQKNLKLLHSFLCTAQQHPLINQELQCQRVSFGEALSPNLLTGLHLMLLCSMPMLKGTCCRFCEGDGVEGGDSCQRQGSPWGQKGISCEKTQRESTASSYGWFR